MAWNWKNMMPQLKKKLTSFCYEGRSSYEKDFNAVFSCNSRGVNEMTQQVLSDSLSLRTSVQDVFCGLKGTWNQVSEKVTTNTNLLFSFQI